MTINPGDIIGSKYRIERELGGGTFAQVYLATHLNLNEPRALKILRRDAPGVGSSEFARYRDRFQLEAQIGAQLERARHAHIVRVYDFEQFDNLLVLVMEFAAGGSLAARIARARESNQPMPIDECVHIAIEIADGLAPIHAMDIVHRDLKPANILFDANGTTKVADLGLAQVETVSLDRDVLGSAADWHPGTPPYMSPEQESTKAYLKPPSDIYALGLILFEMLTGRRYKNQRPGTRAGAMRSDTPEWLDDLLARLLAQDPNARPWDGAETAQALRQAQASDARKISEEQKRKAEEKAKRAAEAKAKRETEEQAERERLAQSQREADAKRLAEVREHSMFEQRTIPAPIHPTVYSQAPFPLPTPEISSTRPSNARQIFGWMLLLILLVVLVFGTLAIMISTRVTLTSIPTLLPPFPTRLSTFAPDNAPMMYVPEGDFTMGYDGATFTSPVHQVYLDAYWIDKFEVTNILYKKCMDAGKCLQPYATKSFYRDSYFGNSQYDNYPVISVNWEQAKAYCEWVGKRLPTEAEWEKAARGTDSRIYPWGNALGDSKANFADAATLGKGQRDTSEVGQYSGDTSPYGVMDLAGNVEEWMVDWYSYYSNETQRNPMGPPSGQLRVIRGGSWMTAPNTTSGGSTSGRSSRLPWGTANTLGFRCARSQ